MISERKVTIIKLLINKRRSIDEIAQILSVSSRTVRRDLLLITDIVVDNGFTLEKDKMNYMIVDPKLELIRTLNRSLTIDYSYEERIVCYFSKIASGYDQLNLEQLANSLYMPIPSIKLEIQNYLNKAQVNHEIKGVKLVINITPIEHRRFLIRIIRDYLKSTDIEHVVLNGTLDVVGASKIEQYLSNYFNVEQFLETFNNIDDIFDENNKYIADFEIVFLTAISLMCKKQQYSMPIYDATKSSYINKVNQQILELASLTNDSEIKFLNDFLEQIITELEYEKVAVTDVFKVNELICAVEEIVGFQLLERNRLKYQISTHNSRYKSMLPTEQAINESLQQFVTENNDLYNHILKHPNFVEYRIDEIQYMLIYFVMAIDETITHQQWNIVVICFGGMGTSLMIKKQLEQMFPQAKTRNLSYARLLSMEDGDYDIIISNSSLPNNMQDVVVDHVVSSDQFKQIKLALRNSINNKKDNGHVQVKPFIKTFQIDIQEHKSATQSILKKLLNNEYIMNNDYIFEKLMKREQVGTGIPNSTIAFFHTNSSSVNRLIVTTYKTNPFVTKGFDGQELLCNRILLVLVPTDISESMLEKVNILSYSLISDTHLLKDINMGNLEAVSKIIN
ncbi:PTS sugar transporter subunit IIA [Mollicutes bacterium LVI A0039]|nr:PTS sugar transporter subunit IIA [Mollicutes bacterium LVI A0039]